MSPWTRPSASLSICHRQSPFILPGPRGRSSTQDTRELVRGRSAHCMHAESGRGRCRVLRTTRLRGRGGVQRVRHGRRQPGRSAETWSIRGSGGREPRPSLPLPGHRAPGSCQSGWRQKESDGPFTHLPQGHGECGQDLQGKPNTTSTAMLLAQGQKLDGQKRTWQKRSPNLS